MATLSAPLPRVPLRVGAYAKEKVDGLVGLARVGVHAHLSHNGSTSYSLASVLGSSFVHFCHCPNVVRHRTAPQLNCCRFARG